MRYVNIVNFSEEEEYPRRRDSVAGTIGKVALGGAAAAGVGYLGAKGTRKLAKKGAKGVGIRGDLSRAYLKGYQNIKNTVKGRKKRNLLSLKEKKRRSNLRKINQKTNQKMASRKPFGPPAPEVYGPVDNRKMYGPGY